MIHYHGLPITPATAAAEVVAGGHPFVSFAHQMQVGLALDMCQSFALDNGAFSAWSSGKPILEWQPFYDWVSSLKRHPGFDWAVIPDVIDGSESDNDALLREWPFPKWVGAPVWHMHESLDRLQRLCADWPRVCIGSSGQYRKVGSGLWWDRMTEAMNLITDDQGLPVCKLHGLRMLDPKVFCKLPLSSADSTNIGRNIGIDKKWTGSYQPPTKEARAKMMRLRIESVNGASEWQRAENEIDYFRG